MLWFVCLFIIAALLSYFISGIIYSIRRFFNPELPSVLSGEDEPLGDFIGNLGLSLVSLLFLAGIPFVILSINFILSVNEKSDVYKHYYQQGYNSYISETIEKSPSYWIDSYNKAWLDGYSSHSKN